MEIKTDCNDVKMEWADDIKFEVKAEDVNSESEDGEGDDIQVEANEEDTKMEVQDFKNECREENVKDFLCISCWRPQSNHSFSYVGLPSVKYLTWPAPA